MTPEAGHKENEDEFVSRVWRFKQNIFQYLWTIYYAWAKPKYLVSKPNPVPVEFDRPEKRPLPPVFFLATGYLLLAVTEKVIFQFLSRLCLERYAINREFYSLLQWPCSIFPLLFYRR
jgi:hypothetical protein